MCSVALPKRPDSYRTITRGASRDGGARRRRDNNRRRQEAPFKRRGGTAGHKSWEKHAWQNCHGPTLRPENMSPSISLLLCPVHPVALAQVAHRRPLPSFAPFAVLCYSSKPPSFTTTFLRTVELQRKTSLPFMRFFLCAYFPSTVLVESSVEIANKKSELFMLSTLIERILSPVLKEYQVLL